MYITIGYLLNYIPIKKFDCFLPGSISILIARVSINSSTQKQTEKTAFLRKFPKCKVIFSENQKSIESRQFCIFKAILKSPKALTQFSISYARCNKKD